MKYCPLMSFAKEHSQKIDCFGKECALAADNAGNCLIKQSLQIYVNETEKRKPVSFISEPYYETELK